MLDPEVLNFEQQKGHTYESFQIRMYTRRHFNYGYLYYDGRFKKDTDWIRYYKDGT